MDEHFWINPLHLDIDIPDSNGTAESQSRGNSRRSRSTDTQLTEFDINVFFEGVRVAGEQIKDLKNHMLDVQYTDLMAESLESHGYSFLKVPDDIITDMRSGLLETYHYLQRYGAALYHILKETEANEESAYYEKLKEAKDKMVRMLCDLQSAIIVANLTPYEDITYGMLPPIIHSKRNFHLAALREFIIIRDYAKFIEYILEKKEVMSE